MATFAPVIKQLRKERDMTQDQLASLLKVSRSTIGMYETGSREPDFETCEAIADIFNVDMDYLMGRTTTKRKNPVSSSSIPHGFEPLPKMVKRPLVGSIACGQPITAEENIEDYVNVPEETNCDFCLRCKGDSMIDAGIHDGDIVYIHIQPEVENGQIAAVRIDGEATLKRVFWNEETQTLQLLAENRNYAPLVYTGPVLESVHIEGRAVGFTHWF